VHGLVEHRLVIRKMIELAGVHAVEVDDGGEVFVIDRLMGVELDGLAVEDEHVGDGAGMAVDIGEVVPGGGVLGVEREGFLILDAGGVLVLGVVEETAKGDVRAGVIGVALEEALVFLANHGEPRFDAALQGFIGDAGALGRGGFIVAHHLVDGGKGGVVVIEQFIVLLLDGIVGVGNVDGNAGGLLEEIAGGSGRIGRQRSAEQTDDEISHDSKITLWGGASSFRRRLSRRTDCIIHEQATRSHKDNS
jgi:hypothetical protein